MGRAHVAVLVGCALSLAAKGATVPQDRDSTLKVVEGRPSIVVGDRRFTCFYSETHPRKMHEHNRQMAEAGVDVFFPIIRGDYDGDYFTSYFWRDDGVFGDESDRDDGMEVRAQVEAILAACPDARLIVRWGSEVPRAWADRHPDQCMASEHERMSKSSYASRLAAAGRIEQAKRIVRYCESQSWGDRIVGYAPFGQDEGTHELSIQHAMFDQAPVMRDEYVAFLRRKYETVERLRAAWGDDSVTYENVRTPTDSQWKADCEKWMHWPEPRDLRRYQDYFLTVREFVILQRRGELAAVKEAAGRPVLVAMDALKQPMSGWLIGDAFFAKAAGMEFRNILLASGSIDVGEMLSWPELDALITPADYTARSCGYGFEPEGIGDSLVLRGKTILVEDDARSWATDERVTQGAWRSVDECRAGLMRNLALSATRGHIPYWMNVGGGYFDDPDVLKVVAEQVPVRRSLLTRPRSETEHAIAMIIDDESPLEEDFSSGFQQLAVLRQRTDELALTGLPHRVYLLSDVARDDFPRFRAYLLPNLFELTPERMALVRDKLMRDGSVVIFGPGTGITDGSKLGSENVSQLLGIPLELVDKESQRRVNVYGNAHPALSHVWAPVTYGDSFIYGPVLMPARDLAGSVELGKASAWWGCNRAGLVLEEHGEGASGNGTEGARGAGDCAVVFSMAVPIPAIVLRSLAVYGGCNPWSDIGDVVGADATTVAIHTTRPGTRLIRLPDSHTVIDAVSGETVARDVREFEITIGAPDTRVFLLE